ncbi:MAG TPA: peptidase M28, partial [Myxococcaceae bacterium]
MGIKKFAPAALLLWSAAPVLAQAQQTPSFAQPAEDREQWITLGEDALEPVQQAFSAQGFAQPTNVQVKDGVVMMKVRESQLSQLSKVMHEKFNRCSGFIAHDSEQEALQALSPAPSPALQQNLVTYTIDNAGTATALMNDVREPNILQTITTMSSYTTRYYTSPTGVESANWLKNHWTSLTTGRTDVSVAAFTHSGWAQPSVILTITG